MKWAKPVHIKMLMGMLQQICSANALKVVHYRRKGWLAKDVKVPLDEPVRFECNKLVSDLAVLKGEFEAGSFDMKELNKRFTLLRPRIEKFLDAEKCIPDRFIRSKADLEKE